MSDLVELRARVQDVEYLRLIEPSSAGPKRGRLERALEDVPSLTALDGWDSLPAVRDERVYVIDAGAYTSRLGPRLVTGLEIMAEVIHPELFTGMIPEGGAVRLGDMTRAG